MIQFFIIDILLLVNKHWSKIDRNKFISNNNIKNYTFLWNRSETLQDEHEFKTKLTQLY